MSGKLLITTLVTSAVIAAFTIASAGQVPAATAGPPAFQSGWHQAFKTIEAKVQGQGYMMLAGDVRRRGGGGGVPNKAVVRDHRSPKPDKYVPTSGQSDTVGGWKDPTPWKPNPSSANPPPLGRVQPYGSLGYGTGRNNLDVGPDYTRRNNGGVGATLRGIRGYETLK